MFNLDKEFLNDNVGSETSYSVYNTRGFDNYEKNDKPSVFNVLITDTILESNSTFAGVLDFYCIHPWIPINDETLQGQVYFTTENFNYHTLIDSNLDGVLDTSLALTNELLNKAVGFLHLLEWEQVDPTTPQLEGVVKNKNIKYNPIDANGNLMYLDVADVQYVIWDLIFGHYAPDYPFFQEVGYGNRNLNTNTHAQLMSNIREYTDTYTPTAVGDSVGLVLLADSYKQPLLTTVKLEPPSSGTGNHPSQPNIPNSKPIPEHSMLFPVLIIGGIMVWNTLRKKKKQRVVNNSVII